MNDTGLLGTILNFTGFGFLNRPGNIHGNRTQFRVRHQAFRTEHAGYAAGQTHHVGSGNAAVKFDFACQDRVDQVFGTDDIGTGGFGLIGFFALSQNGDAYGFAGTVGQRADAANHLVGIFRINAKIDCQINGFVEFGICIFLYQLDGIFQRIQLRLVNGFVCIFDSFSCHCLTPQPLRP